VRELLRLVELIDDDTPSLCITGGEPTLLKRDLIRVVRA
jgi:organic radical activating enzyme